MKTTTDQLVKESLEGHTDSFSILVHRYYGLVYGLAYHILGNFADAEDIVQEVFLKAYLELSQLNDPLKFAGWIRRITINFCNMCIRKQPPNKEEFDINTMPAQNGSDPSIDIERQELCDAVQKAMNSLSEKNRLAVTLFYMDGLSYKRISEFLEVPLTTVESRMHKARKQLKKEIMKMIEQDFSKEKLDPESSMNVVKGTLEIIPYPGYISGYGFVRLGGQKEDDIYVSPAQIKKFNLKNGDTIKGLIRPPKENENSDREEHYSAMLYIYTINNEDPRPEETQQLKKLGYKCVEF